MATPTRWGILGTGAISLDFTAAVMMHQEAEHVVSAVAARTLEKAQTFNEKFDSSIPKVYGSYIEMAQDPDLDVIYIATINSCHYDQAMMMMQAGKNVLVEKPMCVTSAMVKELTTKAKEQGVFIMEGYWSRFFPIYNHLRGELASKSIGDVHTVVVNFGFDLRHLPRQNDPAMGPGDGGLLMMGGYCVQLATMVFNERPERICASGVLAEEGHDLMSSTTLYYKDGRRAILTCCMDAMCDNTATIMGRTGHIRIPDFWCPEKMITPTKTYECPVPKGSREMGFLRSEGFMYEIAGVRDCLLKGEKEASLLTAEHSHIINEIMDEIRHQVGVVYKEDNR